MATVPYLLVVNPSALQPPKRLERKGGKGVKKREFKSKVVVSVRRCQQLIHRLRLLLVHGNMDHATLVEQVVRFLLFQEENPKHRVVRNLSPIHSLLVCYFCFLAPAAIFMATIPYGITAVFLAEFGLVLGVLEAMHIVFDRKVNE